MDRYNVSFYVKYMKKTIFRGLIYLGILCGSIQSPNQALIPSKFIPSKTILAATAALAGAAYCYHSYTTHTIPKLLPENPFIKHIIFDLDGVLLDTNISQTLYSLGIINLFGYLVTKGHFPSKTDLFGALRPIPAINTSFSEHEGKPMPPILVDWQKGTQTHEQLLTSCNQYFQAQYQAGTLSKYETDIFMKLSKLMFDCSEYIASKCAIQSSLDLLAPLAEYAHKHNIQLYILSNWDAQSLDLAQQKFPELFKYFPQDHIVISGKVGLLKPDPALFSYILDTHDINPDECLFIDDEHINITQAQALKIHTIHCTAQAHKNLLNRILAEL